MKRSLMTYNNTFYLKYILCSKKYKNAGAIGKRNLSFLSCSMYKGS